MDISILNDFITEPNEQFISSDIKTIDSIGFDNWFDRQINTFCNCTKTFKDGSRIIQTNDKRYNIEITSTIEMIKKYCDNDKEKYYDCLIKRHIENLEFEKINGFDYEPNKKTQKKITKKKLKQTSIFDNEPKKETAAERKLKAHAMKLNAVLFKPKTVNNENII